MTYRRAGFIGTISLYSRPAHCFLADDLSATDLPQSSYKDTTDANLVRRALRHNLKLATLDMALIAKPWASGHDWELPAV